MFALNSIPDELKQRLLAAGVKDAESLRAALEADADLRAQYERWLVRLVLQRFAATTDAEALQKLTEQLPMLLEPPMIEAIESAIRKAEQRGDAVNAEALRQRLHALHDIRMQHEQAQLHARLARILLAFVQAGDDNMAAAVFWQNRELLATDDAEAVLINQFESQDSTARLHLQRRRQLLRMLRLRWQEMQED